MGTFRMFGHCSYSKYVSYWESLLTIYSAHFCGSFNWMYSLPSSPQCVIKKGCSHLVTTVYQYKGCSPRWLSVQRLFSHDYYFIISKKGSSPRYLSVRRVVLLGVCRPSPKGWEARVPRARQPGLGRGFAPRCGPDEYSSCLPCERRVAKRDPQSPQSAQQHSPPSPSITHTALLSRGLPNAVYCPLTPQQRHLCNLHLK